ncbi:hypothetical protein BY996DRAFT_6557290 [Phakopsora pachyrhizi]|nr:hypothetical protein BY996DRAFT_6557290 [Phakopsora pachyrhizi]
MPNNKTLQAIWSVSQRLEDTLTQDLGAVDKWLKDLELDQNDTKGKDKGVRRFFVGFCWVLRREEWQWKEMDDTMGKRSKSKVGVLTMVKTVGAKLQELRNRKSF